MSNPTNFRCADCGAILEHPRQLHTLADCNHFKEAGVLRFHGLSRLPRSSHSKKQLSEESD